MNSSSPFPWPNRQRAAVSLTYDDATETQRRLAAPRLDHHGLRGTFFLKGASEDLQSHRERWRSIGERGHELASHTMHHPCDCAHDWVPKGFALQDYDLSRMAAELDETLELLASIGAQEPHTFAYPCGESQLGKDGISYAGLVDERFCAARGVEATLADPVSVPLTMVPAIDGAQSARELCALVDSAVAEGRWLVLLFHGVGGEHLPVQEEAHEALLRDLRRRAGEVWVATFRDVAQHIRRARS